MARPKKTIKREKQYSVRLTMAEAKRVEKNAGRYGESVSSYFRKKGLDDRLVPRWTEEEREAYKQLVGMANNLNQLTKLCHERGLLVNQVEGVLVGINKALDKLR